MTYEEFGDQFCSVVSNLWPRYAKSEDFNDDNQRILFRKLSSFPVQQVINAIEGFKIDNSSSFRPDFDAIAGKLWATRKGQSGRRQDRDLRSIAYAWARHRSDDDLAHFRYLAVQRYASVIPKLWRVIEASPIRSPISLIVCWSVDGRESLDFKQGSDEWQEAYLEYDIQECRRENDRLGPWSPKSGAAKVAVAAQLANVRTPDVEALRAATAEPVIPDGAVDYPQDDIPF